MPTSIQHPDRTSYAWVGRIKRTSIPCLLFILLAGMVIFNFSFACVYKYWDLLHYTSGTQTKDLGFGDSLYFSFVTSLTIGYGDIAPAEGFGKLVAVVHGTLGALYFAVSVALLTAKLFYPKDTMIFAAKLCANPAKGNFYFRVLNTHREKLVAPEIRILITEHCFGNGIATSFTLPKIDDQPYMGRHDFTFHFPSIVMTPDGQKIDFIQMWKQALDHDRDAATSEKTRFRISIAILGNYGMQQASFVKNYHPCDIQLGRAFAVCNYNNRDQRKGNIHYQDFPDFWDNFERIQPTEEP